jgi:2-oxoglutarate ferredoxin oxidoreductase subunit gamma
MAGKPQYEVAITGLGGQGALSFGQLIAEAGLSTFRNVAFFPQYATVMRGGESECTVTLSDDDIDTLLVAHPKAAVVMAPPKLKAFESKVKENGTLMVDSSVITEKVERKDLTVYYLPATKAASDLGDKRAANIIFIGAYLELTKAAPLEKVEEVIEKKFSGKDKVIAMNKRALREGARMIAEYQG